MCILLDSRWKVACVGKKGSDTVQFVCLCNMSVSVLPSGDAAGCE